jgi:cytochrome c oxidase cbb3-type subunit 2
MVLLQTTEEQYDSPFQWGSKRTGPDLAYIGGKYTDQWHVMYLKDPRSVVEKSVKFGYSFLETAELDYSNIASHMNSLRERSARKGYTDEQIKLAKEDLKAQLKPGSKEAEALLKRYPGANVRDFDDNPSKITEMDALVAYLQVLGTIDPQTRFQNKKTKN